MNQRTRWLRRAGLAAGLATLLAACERVAIERGEPGAARGTDLESVRRGVGGESVPAPSTAASAAVAPSGLRAVIDPVTGRLTANPSPEQRRLLALAARSSLSRSLVGLRPFDLDSGGRGLHLQGRFQSALRVEVAPEGGFRMTCGDPAHDGTPHAHPEAPELGSSERARPDSGHVATR